MDTHTGTLAALATALVLTVAGCHTPASNADTTAGHDNSGADVGAARAALAGLTIAPEDTGNRYKREEWLPRWATVRGACDTRETALQQQSRDVRTDAQCKTATGSWISPYDGVTITTASGADLDHLVPLAEAARSGTRGWDRSKREAFANDPTQLVVVSARSNRSKGDQDPAKWLPTASYRCTYAARYTLTKAKYRLTVDKPEHDVLAGLLTHC